jgi:hypothetical protein
MKDINSLLLKKYQTADERIEGRLVYLENFGVAGFASPLIAEKTNISFFTAKFSTGYRKFHTIDVVIGARGLDELFVLTNPVFSDKYSNLTMELEKIEAKDIEQPLINEIAELYKLAGTKITEIENNKFQIWSGDNKWRIMEFETNATLKIIMTPNY